MITITTVDSAFSKRPSPWAGQGKEMTGLREISKNVRKILDTTKDYLLKLTNL